MAFNFMNTTHRFWVYMLLFMVAAALLGLTADRIHTTRRLADTYEPIVVELMVASICTILWTPVAMLSVRHKKGDVAYVRSTHMREIAIDVLHWILFLVGAVIFTNRILPGQNYCGLQSMTCKKLTAILALSWTAWSLFTIAIVLALLHHAAATAHRPATMTTHNNHNGAKV